NIEARHEASLAIDRYDDDWSRLGYVLVSGRADLLEPGDPEHAAALAQLRVRYPQYRAMALESRPVIALTPASVVSWGPAVGGGERVGAGAGPGGGLPAAGARAALGAGVSGPAHPAGGAGGDDRGGALGALAARHAALALRRPDARRAEAAARGRHGRGVG